MTTKLPLRNVPYEFYAWAPFVSEAEMLELADRFGVTSENIDQHLDELEANIVDDEGSLMSAIMPGTLLWMKYLLRNRNNHE